MGAVGFEPAYSIRGRSYRPFNEKAQRFSDCMELKISERGNGNHRFEKSYALGYAREIPVRFGRRI